MTIEEDLDGLTITGTEETASNGSASASTHEANIDSSIRTVLIDSLATSTPVHYETSTPTVTTATNTTTDDNNDIQGSNISDTCSNYTCSKDPYSPLPAPSTCVHGSGNSSNTLHSTMEGKQMDKPLNTASLGDEAANDVLLRREASTLSLYEQEAHLLDFIDENDEETCIDRNEQDKKATTDQEPLAQSSADQEKEKIGDNPCNNNSGGKSNWKPANCCVNECSQCSPSPVTGSNDDRCSHSSCCCTADAYSTDGKGCTRCHSHCDSMSNCSIVHDEQLRYQESTVDGKTTAFAIGLPGKCPEDKEDGEGVARSAGSPDSPKLSLSTSRSKGRAPLPPASCNHEHCEHGNCNCAGAAGSGGNVAGQSAVCPQPHAPCQFSIPYNHSTHYHVCPQFNMYDYTAAPNSKVRFYQIGYNTNLKKPPENWQRMKTRYHATSYIATQKPRSHYRYSHLYGYGHSFWSYMSPLAMWPTMKYSIPTSNRSRKNFFSHYFPKSHGGMKNFDLSLCLCCVCCNCSKTNQTSCCCCYHCVHTSSACRRSDILRMVPAPTTASTTPCPPPSSLLAVDDVPLDGHDTDRAKSHSPTNVIVSILKKATGKGSPSPDLAHLDTENRSLSPGPLPLKQLPEDQMDEQQDSSAVDNIRHKVSLSPPLPSPPPPIALSTDAVEKECTNGKSHSIHGCCFQSLTGSHRDTDSDDEDDRVVANAKEEQNALAMSSSDHLAVACDSQLAGDSSASELLLDMKERGV